MNNRLRKTLLWILVLAVFCFCINDYSFARSRRSHGSRWHRPVRHSGFHHRGHRHYSIFHPAMFFLGLMTGLVIDPPSRVEVVYVLPPGHTRVILRGEPYYYYDGIYYRRYQSGYVVVPESEIEELQRLRKKQEESSKESASDSAEVSASESAESHVEDSGNGEYVVNIPNSDGTFTAVKLKKHKDGYVGPQGEFYSGKPTVKQLKVLYGK